MKKITLFILLIALFLGACKNSDTSCYHEILTDMENNPVETTKWLQDLRLSLSSTDAYIALYKWEDEEYFYVYTQAPKESNDFATVSIYKSDGSIYAYCGGNSHPDKQSLCEIFNEKATFITKLWENNSCK